MRTGRPDAGPSWLLFVIGAGLLACAFFALRAIGYYTLPVDARGLSPLHESLRPSGSVGHLYGAVGTAILLGNLLYLARRRFARATWLGPMRGWLRWHVASGVLGPALVALHSAFTMRSQVAIASSISLAVLVVTGLVGRYLYALVPRRRDGTEREAGEVRADLDHALMHLRELGVPGRAAADALEQEADRALGGARDQHERGSRAVIDALRLRWRLRAMPGIARRAARGASATPAEVRVVDRAASGLALLELEVDARWIVEGAALAWRGVHRAFAFVMVMTAALHIAVAFYLGYGLGF